MYHINRQEAIKYCYIYSFWELNTAISCAPCPGIEPNGECTPCCHVKETRSLMARVAAPIHFYTLMLGVDVIIWSHRQILIMLN